MSHLLSDDRGKMKRKKLKHCEREGMKRKKCVQNQGKKIASQQSKFRCFEASSVSEKLKLLNVANVIQTVNWQRWQQEKIENRDMLHTIVSLMALVSLFNS